MSRGEASLGHSMVARDEYGVGRGKGLGFYEFFIKILSFTGGNYHFNGCGGFRQIITMQESVPAVL